MGGGSSASAVFSSWIFSDDSECVGRDKNVGNAAAAADESTEREGVADNLWSRKVPSDWVRLCAFHGPRVTAFDASVSWLLTSDNDGAAAADTAFGRPLAVNERGAKGDGVGEDSDNSTCRGTCASKSLSASSSLSFAVAHAASAVDGPSWAITDEEEATDARDVDTRDPSGLKWSDAIIDLVVVPGYVIHICFRRAARVSAKCDVEGATKS